ncbi:MAG: DUF4412 domain-containing protein [Flavobacteriales bacterium]|nr:DUF4412 domain-containing protein [Flavobacteriales bacterium]MCB9448773.1 DUF4412 domain-containing protein [Flavobacteriales bacterium]
MKHHAKYLAAVAALFFGTVGASMADGFEGTIEFVKMTQTDTSNYVYYVKGDHIRIENTVRGEVKGVMLVDLGEKSLLALSPERKLYMDVNNSPLNPGDKNNYEVMKTGNKKTIQGFECEQVRVRNKSQNTEVTYWLASGGFQFFPSLINTVNRKENTSIYYLVIDGFEDAFPFLTVENSLLREERTRMEVTKITKKSIDDKLFNVPDGYVKFEK